MMKKLFILCVATIISTAIWANCIKYKAISKLEDESLYNHAMGFCSQCFDVPMTAHVFSEGEGCIFFWGDVTRIGKDAFSGCVNLISIDIPNSVTTIGDFAFSGCINLSSINVGDSIIVIGDSAFYGCSSLTSIELPNTVTTIGNAAFASCSGLTSVTIPNSVTTIGARAFSGCSGLTLVTIPNSIISIGIGVFGACTALTTPIYNTDFFIYLPENYMGSYTIPDGITEIVSEAFYRCSSLTSVIIPNSVSTIGRRVFMHCKRLSSVKIGNSVSTIGDHAFYGCSSLTSVNIPNSVIEIGDVAFDYCDKLSLAKINSNTICNLNFGYSFNLGHIFGFQVKDFIIGDSVMTIGRYAFDGCSNLTSVTIGKSVTMIGYGAFFGCSGLTSINVDAANTHYCSIDGVLFNYAKDTLIQYPIGNTRTTYIIPKSVTMIGCCAFEDCRGLVSITSNATIPPSCDSYCFYNVDKSISVYVPAQSITAYKQANGWKDFYNIYSIEQVLVSVNNSAYGSVQGSGHQQSEIITLTAIPAYGYHFSRWSDGNSENPRSFILMQDTAFTAEFAINIYSFDVQTADPVMGSVTGTKGNYEHGTSLTLFAKSNYGYHFDHWSDGNKQEQRTISLTKDTSLIAYFAKNIYSVCVSKSQYGTIQGAGKYDYLNICTLIATPDFGYEFVSWSDGNTDNPRTLVVTQDASFTVEIVLKDTISGQCGDNLSFCFIPATGALIIMGMGAMYDSGFDSWSRWADQITSISMPEGLTHIGDNAFKNCSNVQKIEIPTTVTSIGNYALSGCTSIRSVTCFAEQIPTAGIYTFYGLSQYTKAYVMASLLEDYQFAMGWRDLNLQPIEATNPQTPIEDGQVIVVPTDNQVTLTWPAEDQASEYVLEITKDGVVFCTLKFNAQGQLTGIAFAPGRGGEQRAMPAAEMTTSGWQFTVTGLNQGSNYAYTLDVTNAQQQSIKHYEGEFTTTGATGLERLTIDDGASAHSDKCTVKKMIIDNQLFIFRGDKIYNAAGQKVK